jgi:hypothetical protein
MQFNGIQINPTGLDARTAHMDQGEQISENTVMTVRNNAIYNWLQVMFQGKQTDQIKGYNASDLFSHPNTGLNATIDKDAHKFITEA